MDPFQNHPPVRQKPSGCSTVILILVALGLAGVGGAVAYYAFTHDERLAIVPTAGAAEQQAGTFGTGAVAIDDWNGSTTFECTGAQHVTIAGRTIAATATPALRATGACQLDLVGVTLTAPTAIEATGGSHVSITGGAITGTVTAIDASGGAHVDVVGARITGRVHRGGGAEITGAR